VQGLYYLRPISGRTDVRVLRNATICPNVIQRLQEAAHDEGTPTRGLRLTDDAMRDALVVLDGTFSKEEFGRHLISAFYATKHTLSKSYAKGNFGRLVTRSGLIVAFSYEYHGLILEALAMLGPVNSIKEIVDFIASRGFAVNGYWVEELFEPVMRLPSLNPPGTPGVGALAGVSSEETPKPVNTPINPRHRWDRSTTPKPPKRSTPGRLPVPSSMGRRTPASIIRRRRGREAAQYASPFQQNITDSLVRERGADDGIVRLMNNSVKLLNKVQDRVNILSDRNHQRESNARAAAQGCLNRVLDATDDDDDEEFLEEFVSPRRYITFEEEHEEDTEAASVSLFPFFFCGCLSQDLTLHSSSFF
jgi:hypothetical protein